MDWTGHTLGGRYQLESELGRGGMGSVYLGRDQSFRSRRVVVKVPHPNLLNDEFRARFELEIDQLVTLEHPRVIHVYDAGEHEGVPYLVVQYVDGGDLDDRMPKGQRIPAIDVLKWLGPMADALDFVHRKGAVHRDMKPGNILFDADDNPYLSDFGISTIMSSIESTHAGAAPGQLTQAGSWVGSPAYAPPEMVTRELSPQYDQYSLAAVAYEALAGGLPFEAKSTTDMLTAKMRGTPTPISERVKGIPEAAADAIMRALQPLREDRFETCTEFVQAFQAGLEGKAARPSVKPTTLRPTLSDEPREKSGSGLGRIVAIAAAIVVLLGIGFVTIPNLVTDAEEPLYENASSGDIREVQPGEDETLAPGDTVGDDAGLGVAGSDPGVETVAFVPDVEPAAFAGPGFDEALDQLVASIGDPSALLAAGPGASSGEGPFPSNLSLCAPLSPGFGATAPALWRNPESGAWSYSCTLGEELDPTAAASRFSEIASRVRDTVPSWQFHQHEAEDDQLRAEMLAVRPGADGVGLRLSHWSFGPSKNQLELWVESEL